jgi:lipopolysaccharide transport system ATP-binding protein
LSQPAIRVHKLSKEYRLGHNYQQGPTFREMLVDVAKSPFRRLRSTRVRSTEIFSALRDVSFEVQPGEVVGVIGRNGAGKSTLLKILSRITEPTSGRAELRGRVASLLEVGTGFHPELTGRENVFLNGALMGMSRAEVSRKFDAIVAFSEVEKFLDTPVKHYSSGMYVRLAFAVAAHLEPEILIVDEVLAVGDMAFQRKCLGKMRDFVGRSGRTVLFVSHNMAAIESLCDRAMLFEGGRLVDAGSPQQMTRKYLSGVDSEVYDRDLTRIDRPVDFGEEVRFTHIRICDDHGRMLQTIRLGEEFNVEFAYTVKRAQRDMLLHFRIETVRGELLIDSWDRDSLPREATPEGEYRVRIRLSPQDLHPGQYQITLIAAVHMVRWLDRVVGALVFSVESFSENEQLAPERAALLYKKYDWFRTRFTDAPVCAEVAQSTKSQ